MARTLKLDHLTKIEGHAKLTVKVDEGKVKKAQLEVFEGARYFEGILKGRKYHEAGYIASRICGVCSQAHMLTAYKAVENALDVEVTNQTFLLRKLLLLGQILQSHVLHLYFLALPDYLNKDSAISMAASHPEEIKRGLAIKRLANDIVQVIGGREVHSITPVVGGFSHIPPKRSLDELLERLKAMYDDIVHVAELFGNIPVPEFERKTEYVALGKPDSYPFLVGSITSTEGLNISRDKYKHYLSEYTANYSTAKFVVSEGKGYMVGSLARINQNRRMLSDKAREVIEKSGHDFPSHNPFLNNFAQAVEMVHMTDRMIQILSENTFQPEQPVDFQVKAGHGIAASEVGRGLLFHEYEIDDKGIITKAEIVPPTTQNLKNIEDDIKAFLPTILHKSEKEVILDIEKLIRSYDPCISCSTHFLKVKWE